MARCIALDMDCAAISSLQPLRWTVPANMRMPSAAAIRRNQVPNLPSSRTFLGITYWPEFNVAVFAILLNLPWEFLQVPFFRQMPSSEHWEGVKACTRATFGDAVIMLIAYWGVAVRGGRHWLLHSGTLQLAAFITIGLVITIAIEKLAVAGFWIDNWTYSAHMVIVPGLEVGLTPLLQWIVLPPLVIWFCKRQIGPWVEV